MYRSAKKMFGIEIHLQTKAVTARHQQLPRRLLLGFPRRRTGRVAEAENREVLL